MAASRSLLITTLLAVFALVAASGSAAEAKGPADLVLEKISKPLARVVLGSKLNLLVRVADKGELTARTRLAVYLAAAVGEIYCGLMPF